MSTRYFTRVGAGVFVVLAFATPILCTSESEFRGQQVSAAPGARRPVRSAPDAVTESVLKQADPFRIGATVFSVLETAEPDSRALSDSDATTSNSPSTPRVAKDSLVYSHPMHDVSVDYELHVKRGASSLADLPLVALRAAGSSTTESGSAHAHGEAGEEVVLVLREEQAARSKTHPGSLLVGSATTTPLAEDDNEKGHLMHSLRAAGLHKLEHGRGDQPGRILSHVLEVVEVLPATHGEDGTFAVRARSVPPASLFSKGRISVSYNHTTPRPVRRLTGAELEANAAAAHAAAAAEGRRLSSDSVATESVCASQCDSSWNFFYKNWLESDYFMDDETNNCGVDEATCTLCLACFEWRKETDAFQFNYDPATEGAVTSEYEIVSWDDLETEGKVVCKDCWANLGTEIELLVDWDEYDVIMNEFTAQLVGDIAYNFEIVTEIGWAVEPGTMYEIASYETPDLSVLGLLTIGSVCTLSVELLTTGATFVSFNLGSSLNQEAAIGAQYIREDSLSPGTWDWIDNLTWPKEPVTYSQTVQDDTGALTDKATIEATLDIRLDITAELTLYGWVGIVLAADTALRPYFGATVSYSEEADEDTSVFGKLGFLSYETSMVTGEYYDILIDSSETGIFGTQNIVVDLVNSCWTENEFFHLAEESVCLSSSSRGASVRVFIPRHEDLDVEVYGSTCVNQFKLEAHIEGMTATLGRSEDFTITADDPCDGAFIAPYDGDQFSVNEPFTFAWNVEDLVHHSRSAHRLVADADVSISIVLESEGVDGELVSSYYQLTNGTHGTPNTGCFTFDFGNCRDGLGRHANFTNYTYVSGYAMIRSFQNVGLRARSTGKFCFDGGDCGVCSSSRRALASGPPPSKMYRSPKLDQQFDQAMPTRAGSTAVAARGAANSPTPTTHQGKAGRKLALSSGSSALRAPPTKVSSSGRDGTDARALAEFEIPMNKSLTASLYFGLDSTVNLKSVSLSLIGNLWTASLWQSDHDDFEFALVDITTMSPFAIEWKSTTEITVEEIECTAITPSPTIVFLNPRYDTSDCSPSSAPTSHPSLAPVPVPTPRPSPVPTTFEPTPSPTAVPSPVPTIPAPSAVPSPSPTKQPAQVMLPVSMVLTSADFFETNWWWILPIVGLLAVGVVVLLIGLYQGCVCVCRFGPTPMDVKFGEGSHTEKRKEENEDVQVAGTVLLGSQADVLRTERGRDVLRTQRDDFQRASARGPLGENPMSNRSLLAMGGFGGSPKTRRGHKESAVDSEISEVSELIGDVELV